VATHPLKKRNPKKDTIIDIFASGKPEPNPVQGALVGKKKEGKGRRMFHRASGEGVSMAVVCEGGGAGKKKKLSEGGGTPLSSRWGGSIIISAGGGDPTDFHWVGEIGKKGPGNDSKGN